MFQEKGFAHSYIFAIIIIVLVIAGVSWRVVTTQQNASTQNKQATTDLIPALSAEEQAELKAKNGDIPPTAETTPSVATTQTEAPKPTNNATTGATTQTQTPAPAPSATPTPQPAPTAPTVLRPTAEFCAQKAGASFTNIWFTQNSTYTYNGYAWENGYSYTLPQVSKTETGTPLRNYDTLQIFDVVDYGTQPKWGTCSDKAGYLTVYYTVPNSPYTFNVLVEFAHVSLQQP